MSDFPYEETTITPSPAGEPSSPVPQQLVELHGWGRAAGTRAHLTAIDSVAERSPPCGRPAIAGSSRAVSAAATATRPRTPAAPP